MCGWMLVKSHYFKLFCNLNKKLSIVDNHYNIMLFNLSPIQRIAVIEKKREYYERKAKERQSKAGGDKKSKDLKKSLVMNSSQVIMRNKRRRI